MRDIIESMRRAVVKNGWLYGDKIFRLGFPFGWSEYEHVPEVWTYDGSVTFLQHLSLFSGKFPTPAEFRTDDHDEMLAHIEGVLRMAFRHFCPFFELEGSRFQDPLEATALLRTQDYAYIKTFCTDLGENVRHLDIGSGIGSHSTYSIQGLKGQFYSVEAIPSTYTLQRQFYRLMGGGEGIYLDPVEMQNHGIEDSVIKEHMNHPSKYRIKHIPSWHYDWVEDNTIDVASVTWVLNEVEESALLWLLANTSRVLRQDGYFYIRDSQKLHQFNEEIGYDDLLLKMGFEEVSRHELENRVEYYGIPRVYKKVTKHGYSYDELVDLSLGDFAKKSLGRLYL